MTASRALAKRDSSESVRDRCAIVGTGTTDYTFNSGRSTLTLAAQAASAAIADAGLNPGDIDGIVRCEMDEVLHADLAATLGLPNVTSGPQAVGRVLRHAEW